MKLNVERRNKIIEIKGETIKWKKNNEKNTNDINSWFFKMINENFKPQLY